MTGGIEKGADNFGGKMQSLASAILAVTLTTAAAGIIALGIVFFNYMFAGWLGSDSGRFLIYGFVIAITNNIDNLGARIAYSIQGTRVSLPINLWISLITFFISAGAAYMGASVSGSFGAEAASVAAMLLLVGLGAIMIVQARREPWHDQAPPEKDVASLWNVLLRPHHADVDASKHIDLKEGTVLGVALSINNIGGGLSAGIIGVTPWLVGGLSALISFLALWAGNYLAEFFVRKGIANKANIVGGALLIVIGVKQVF
jgi:putative sporulation protein YtaF